MFQRLKVDLSESVKTCQHKKKNDQRSLVALIRNPTKEMEAYQIYETNRTSTVYLSLSLVQQIF